MIRQAYDQYIYIGNSIFLLSYLTTNILLMRSLIIIAAIFFILWGTVNVALQFQVDTICFNAVLILINIYKIIPLLEEFLPVSLKPLEKEIYERDFKNFSSQNINFDTLFQNLSVHTGLFSVLT